VHGAFDRRGDTGRGVADGLGGTMKKLLLLCLLALPVLAQQPDCQILVGPWTDTKISAQSDNRTTACVYWVLTYQVTGFSAISLAFESASGASAPGAFGNFSGTVSSGVNPSTSVACGTPGNCTATFTGQVGWYRMNFASHTGNGTIQGVLKGFKVGQALGGAPVSGAGCPGTVGTPCVVVGAVAPGMAPGTAFPVEVAGFDGTNIQPVSVNPAGNIQNQPIGDATFLSGQQAVTATAVALATHAARAICVSALLANTIPVYLGATGVLITTGLELQPGQNGCFMVNNSNLIFVVASTTGASVTWALVN
jgi:hypothetical protein